MLSEALNKPTQSSNKIPSKKLYTSMYVRIACAKVSEICFYIEGIFFGFCDYIIAKYDNSGM